MMYAIFNYIPNIVIMAHKGKKMAAYTSRAGCASREFAGKTNGNANAKLSPGVLDLPVCISKGRKKMENDHVKLYK